LEFHSGREADHSPPSSAEVKEWVELYLHSPNTPSWRGVQLGGAQGQLLHTFLLNSLQIRDFSDKDRFHFRQVLPLSLLMASNSLESYYKEIIFRKYMYCAEYTAPNIRRMLTNHS
jgi:hypothetical protein